MADRDGGRRDDGATSQEREELRRLRKAKADAVLVERFRAIHEVSKETYGAPRIHAELADEGRQMARKRVERLRKVAGIAGVSRRRGARTIFLDKRLRPARDLVDRNFYADAPDTLWVTFPDDGQRAGAVAN